MPSPWDDALAGRWHVVGLRLAGAMMAAPPPPQGSQLGTGGASEGGVWWLLVWGCSSPGGEKGWLASRWYPDGVFPNWELPGGTGARRVLVLGSAIVSQPMSCNYPALPCSPPSISLPACN